MVRVAKAHFVLAIHCTCLAFAQMGVALPGGSRLEELLSDVNPMSLSEQQFVLDGVRAWQESMDFAQVELELSYEGYCDQQVAKAAMEWARSGSQERVALKFGPVACGNSVPDQIIVNNGSVEWTYFPWSGQGLAELSKQNQLTLAPAPLDFFRPLSRRTLDIVVQEGIVHRFGRSVKDADIVVIEVTYHDRQAAIAVKESAFHAIVAWRCATCRCGVEMSYETGTGGLSTLPAELTYVSQSQDGAINRTIRARVENVIQGVPPPALFERPFPAGTLLTDYTTGEQRTFEVDRRGVDHPVAVTDGVGTKDREQSGHLGLGIAVGVVAIGVGLRLLARSEPSVG